MRDIAHGNDLNMNALFNPDVKMSSVKAISNCCIQTFFLDGGKHNALCMH